MLADRDRDALEAVAGELHAPAVCMDVTSADDYERLAQAAGPVDLVCLNAGISSAHGGPVWETPAAQWQQVMDVNLGVSSTDCARSCRACSPRNGPVTCSSPRRWPGC